MVIAEERLKKAFMDRKEAAVMVTIHTIKIEVSVKVHRIEVKAMDSFAKDYKLELKAFMVTMAYTRVDQTFKGFENSCLLNSYLS